METLNGEEWRVGALSVHRLIAQTKEQQRLTHEDTPTPDPTGHLSEMPANPRPTGAGHAQTIPDSTGSVPQAIAQQPVHDMTGQGGTVDDLSNTDQPSQDPLVSQAGKKCQQENASGQQGAKINERLIIQMERENDLLRDQLERKDNQIENKDKQIDDLIERGREDKMLIQNFQRKLGMLSAPEEDRPVQASPAQNYHHPDQTRLPWQGSQKNENPDWTNTAPDQSVDNSGGRS